MEPRCRASDVAKSSFSCYHTPASNNTDGHAYNVATAAVVTHTVSSSHCSSIGGRRTHEAPLLTKELLATDSHWGRKNHFFLEVRPLVDGTRFIQWTAHSSAQTGSTKQMEWVIYFLEERT